MSLSPDVEKGFQLDSAATNGKSKMAGRRRASPPGPNSRKLGQTASEDELVGAVDEYYTREEADISRLDRDKPLNRSKPRLDLDKARLAPDRINISRFDHPDRGGMLGEKRRRLGPSPRAVYGWLHQQSGFIFILVVFLVFLRAGLHAAAPPSPPVAKSSSSSSFAAKAKAWIPLMGGSSAPHPIPGLMDAAETRFRAKVGKQSTNLAGAVAEYKKRYGRPPPRGFDQWYNFAVKHKFVMIDEFDTVVEDLAPFWNLEGQEVRDRARLVGALPSIDVVQVRGGKATTVRGGDGQWEDAEVSARAAGFRSMLGQFVKDLPDMDFTINAKAEGRVVVPWEHVAYPNLTQDASTILSPSTFRPDWAGLGSVWDAWRRTCPPTSPARRLYSAVGPGWAGVSGGKDRLAEAYREWTLGASARSDKQTVFATGTAAVGTGRAKVNKSKAGAAGEDKASAGHPGIGSGSEFAFARDTNAGLDFCNAPGAHYEQGHFFSDWRVLGALVPVFSPARTRGFGDIRVPSHYYYGGTRRYTYAWDPINLEQRAVDPMEVPWEEKRDVVWWRGASTGGGSSPKGFGGGYQRHRFLRMSSVGLVSGTLADAQRTTPVTFAVPPQPEQLPGTGVGQQSYTSPASADSNTPAYTTVPVPLAALNADVMDTAFVKAVVPVGPEHRFGNSVQLGESWRYKYLLDLDGMGYSGRFMAFLASDSVPVKATVYDEFFSEWIEPWVHYIPLSAGYAEMYNIVAYFSGPPPSALRAANLGVTSAFRGSTYRPPFAPDDDEPADEVGAGLGAGPEGQTEHRIAEGDSRLAPAVGEVERPLGQVERRGVQAKRETRGVEKRQAEDAWRQQQPLAVRSAAQEEGDRRLRRIARAGKQWKQTIGRKVDMEVYVYRLAIEYARLWADDREAMSYHS